MRSKSWLCLKLIPKQRWIRSIGTIGLVYCCLQFTEQAIAQVVRDRTLPQPTRVNRQGEIIEITGGTRSGRNLFHSFERFSVPEGRAAFFNNPAAITNIFSRVTGRSVSQINGELRANGSANLFLLNPNGIIFGSNASLNVGGSFFASTANAVQFAEGQTFSAVNPQAAPLLTVSVPIGLQFAGNPGAILVQGNGHNLFLNSPTDLSVNRRDRPVGLQVNSGRTLALLGGEIALRGGNLTAAAGRIELGSVTSGQVELLETNAGWRFGYEAVPEFREIRLTQAASVEVSGDRGGQIQVQGRRIQVEDASAMLADTLGNGSGGLLTLRATEQVQVRGFSVSSSGPFVSRLSTDVAATAAGQGGTLTIATPDLSIAAGGQVSSGTFGSGDAGTLQIQTENLSIRGGSSIGPSGLFVTVESTASGNGGNLTVLTDQLQMTDRAQIAASTFGGGDAGRLTIQANQVDLRGGSGLFAIVEQGATGNGDRLILHTDRLSLSEGAQITTLTAGEGNAGNIQVKANMLEITGRAGPFASGLLASVEPSATGNGGQMTITADRLQIREGGQIATTTFGLGAAGEVRVQADEIEINGGSTTGPSAIFAASRGNGNGGPLTLNTARLRVTEGGQIATATSGPGRAGDLTIMATESVELIGGNELARSGLFASAIDGTETGNGTGTGGNLRVSTDRLRVADGATISVSNFPSGSFGLPGQGGVGNLVLEADRILLDRGILTADSAAGDRGNVTIQSNSLLMRGASNIRTNAMGSARGGNLGIDTALLSAIENSDITANSVSNLGGQITIQAGSVLGTQIRNQLTAASDITAFSELGASFSGTVKLDASIVDPSQGVVPLPEGLIDRAQQVAAVCQATEGSEFIVTGLGGLPEAPTQRLRGGTLWEDLRIPEMEWSDSAMNQLDSPTYVRIDPTENVEDPSIEAQGWMRDAKGQIVLVAELPTVFPSGITPASPITPASGQAGIDCAADRQGRQNR